MSVLVNGLSTAGGLSKPTSTVTWDYASTTTTKAVKSSRGEHGIGVANVVSEGRHATYAHASRLPAEAAVVASAAGIRAGRDAHDA